MIIKKIIKVSIPSLLILTGILVLLYPNIASYISEATSTQVIINYDAQVKSQSKQTLKQKDNNIKNFNKDLKTVVYKNNKSNNKKQMKVKSVYKDGEMEGYISIPSISAVLPIYEGTSEATLSKGLGHLKKSSLPGGGKSTHCVLTGHSGLSTAVLLTHLDDVKIDDVFYIHYLNKIIEYQVESKQILLPIDANKKLKIEKGKDLVTLVTCTPTPTNTHRLLVRAHRIPYDFNQKEKDIVKHKKQEQEQITSNTCWILALVICVFIIVTIIVCIRKKRRDKCE